MSIEAAGVLTIPKEELTAQHLRRLFAGGHGSLNAIVMPDFIGREEIEHTLGWLGRLKTADYANDVRGPDGSIIAVESYGVSKPSDAEPFNTTFGTPPDSPERRHYQERVEPQMGFYESVSWPYRWVGYSILDLFDRLHPGGATRARLVDDKPALLGMPRLTLPDFTKLQEEPHVDMLPPELVSALGEKAVMFSTNVYYSTPNDSREGGGDLLTYPNGVDQPPVRITPQPGDGVIIRTTDRHAVAAYKYGQRWSIQVFGAASQNPETPIQMWN